MDVVDGGEKRMSLVDEGGRQEDMTLTTNYLHLDAEIVLMDGKEKLGRSILAPGDVEVIEKVNINNDGDTNCMAKNMLGTKVDKGDKVLGMESDGKGLGFLIPDDPPPGELGLYCSSPANKDPPDSDLSCTAAGLVKCLMLQLSNTDDNTASGGAKDLEDEEESQDGWQQETLARKKARKKTQIQATR
jgi:hypothetical protein